MKLGGLYLSGGLAFRTSDPKPELGGPGRPSPAGLSLNLNNS